MRCSERLRAVTRAAPRRPAAQPVRQPSAVAELGVVRRCYVFSDFWFHNMTEDELIDLQCDTIHAAGLALYSVQYCERHFGRCFAKLVTDHPQVDPEAFFQLERDLFQEPLGALIHKMKECFSLDDGFQSRVETFKTDRNRFIHRLFSEPETMIEKPDTCLEALAFIRAIQRDAEAIADTLSLAMSALLARDGIPAPQGIIDRFGLNPVAPALFHERLNLLPKPRKRRMP